MLPTGNVNDGSTRLAAPSDNELADELRDRGWVRAQQEPNDNPDYRSGGAEELR